MLNDLGVVGVPEEDWEGKASLSAFGGRCSGSSVTKGKKADSKASGRRGQQIAVQYAERYSLPFPEAAAAAAAQGVNLYWVGGNSSSHQGFA